MTYSAEVLADSPLVYWRLGEASGTTAADASGNSRTGTYSFGTSGTRLVLGTAGLLTGDADTAVTITGASSTNAGGVSIADASWLEVSSITLECWIKTTVSSGAMWDRDPGTGVRPWQHRLNGGKVEFVRVCDSTGGVNVATITSVTSVNDGNRHHLVMTYDGTNVKLYIDGVLDKTQAVSGGLATTSTDALRFGWSPGGASYLGTAASVVDELAYYGTALSAARILAHYTAGSTGPQVALAGTRQARTAAFAGYVQTNLALAAVRPARTASFAVTSVPAVALAATRQPRTAAFTLDITAPLVVLAGTRQPRTAAFALDVPAQVVLAGTRQARTAAFNIAAFTPMALAATRQARTASFLLDIPSQILLAATRQPRTAAFELAKPPTTNITRSGGRIRSGSGVITTLPTVEPTPEIYVIHDYEVAIAHQVTTVDGRPDITQTTAQIARDRHRIIVGGVDITYFRGVPTLCPAYRLVKPFLYGAGSLSLPQVSPAFERLGVGDLKWLYDGAPIKVQRVTREGAVVATDYEGLLTCPNIDGNKLTYDLGGEVTGRAALTYRPVPVFRKNADAGYWLSRGFLRYASRSLVGAAPITTGRLGPILNVPVADIGGMDAIDYLNQLVALTTSPTSGQAYEITKVGTQWTVLPRDTGTIAATVYFDDARMKPSLKSDMAEKPNTIYATGVSPTGERIMFRRYPGLTEANPAPYPFASNAPFGLGTTNDDCDHPEDAPIQALGGRLVQAGMMPVGTESGTFTADYVAATRRVQREAGYSITGVMNPATWRACWDIDVTGYRLAADTWPAAQATEVRRWNHSAAGAVLTANPGFRSSVIPVHRQVDMGTGFTRAQITDWARDQIAEGDNWIGTVDCNLALIRGTHVPGDPLDPADVMPVAEIRPGMNIWAPLFDGGTLFHVSGVSIPEGGRGGTLTLDTRARPTMEAWEVIRAARESRKNPARIWLNQYRSSQQSKDMGTWDDVGGYVKRTRLRGGEWNVIAVVGGQEGTIRSMRAALSPNREFVIAVFGKKISEGRLNHLVPNPLSAAGSAKWEKEATRHKLDAKLLLYTVGSDASPAGYWPRQKGSGNPLTGKWYDDAGFSYHTFADPVLYMAIYVANDTWIDAGRIFTQQLESGA